MHGPSEPIFEYVTPRPVPGLNAGQSLPLALCSTPGLVTALQVTRRKDGYEGVVELHRRAADGTWRREAGHGAPWLDDPFARPEPTPEEELGPWPFAHMTRAWSDGFAPRAHWCLAGVLDRRAARLTVETDDGAWDVPFNPMNGAFVAGVVLGASGECLLSVFGAGGDRLWAAGGEPWRYRDARVVSRSATLERIESLPTGGLAVRLRAAAVLELSDGTREPFDALTGETTFTWSDPAPLLEIDWALMAADLHDDLRGDLGIAGVRLQDRALPPVGEIAVEPGLAAELAAHGLLEAVKGRLVQGEDDLSASR